MIGVQLSVDNRNICWAGHDEFFGKKAGSARRGVIPHNGGNSANSLVSPGNAAPLPVT